VLGDRLHLECLLLCLVRREYVVEHDNGAVAVP
jgi:hypothetical protein